MATSTPSVPSKGSPATPVRPLASTPGVTPPASQDIKCEDYLPGFVCNPELPGVDDIPLWVWAFGASSLAGFTALAYVSFKAAPYVLPIVSPETAPIAKAWRRARAGEDKLHIAHDMFTSLKEQRARPAPRTNEELQALREEALKEAFAELLAQRKAKQLLKAARRQP